MANVPNDKLIEALKRGDDAALLELDAHGLTPMPGETREAFVLRLAKLAAARNELLHNLRNTKKFEAAPGIVLAADAAIPGAVTREALAETERLYAVSPDWVPGYFVTESFGLLWGGCSLSDPESGLALFIIRRNFRSKRRWLIYDRRELLAHELCHAAHQNINEWQFEEYFAYRTSDKPLRRRFGNSFVRKYDALGFLVPILLLPVVEALNVFTPLALPTTFFWILAAVYPAFLCVRNFRAQLAAHRARNFLRAGGVQKADAVLFRLSVREIMDLSKHKIPEINDLRRKVLERFGWNNFVSGENVS